MGGQRAMGPWSISPHGDDRLQDGLKHVHRNGKNDVMFRSGAVSRIAAMCDHNECGKRSLTAAPF